MKLVRLGLVNRLARHREQLHAATVDADLELASAVVAEQSRGEPINHKSDVFSFAAVLYEMLTGKPAFTGNNVLHVLDEIRNVDADRYAAALPEPFASILRDSFVRDVR